MLGELHRVAKVVDEYLADAQGVAYQWQMPKSLIKIHD